MKFQLICALIALIFAVSSLETQAQMLPCGTKVTKADREYALEHLSNSRSAPVTRLFRKISITAHIVKDSLGGFAVTEGQVLAAVESLNSIMDTIKLSFEVCDFREVENHNFSKLIREEEEAEMIALNYQVNTLNMYFVKEIWVGGAPAGGYAYLPGGPDVVVLAGTGAMKHEVGHYLGLFHTFETSVGGEFVNLSNCETAGDLVCDTDADPYFPEIEYDPITCNLTETWADSNGDLYVPPMDNIMSYYGPCRCRFSRGQYQRMADTYLQSRAYLW